jgi:demethylmenaquinone methyltransferase/2-methoxy-6-polyprenyl-1,4-benzoquinol methylase
MDTVDNIAERKQRIQEMFNGIARRYDLLNHLLSMGIDLYWRRRALSLTRTSALAEVLDLATGTGDFALAAGRLKPRWVVGIDVAVQMLKFGQGKIEAGAAIRLMAGDAERLPFANDSFDLVTVAFGVRNFGHIPTGLSEAWRVLRPGGEFLILDFADPEMPIFKQLYRFYFKRILPLIGGIISGNRPAYSYLPRSVGEFPQGKAFLDLLEVAGFRENRATRLTFGVAYVYQGLKGSADVD